MFLKKFLILNILFIANVMAWDGETAQAITFSSKIYQIDQVIIDNVIKQESSGNPLAIGAVIHNALSETIKKVFLKLNVKFVASPYKGNYTFFDISPTNTQQALAITNLFDQIGVDNYDVGLMQINSKNIKAKGLDIEMLVENRAFNVWVGTGILRECFNKFYAKGSIYVFECYNKGYNTNKFTGDYAQKVLARIMEK